MLMRLRAQAMAKLISRAAISIAWALRRWIPAVVNLDMKKGFTPLEIPNSNEQNTMQSRNLAQRKSLTGFTLVELLLYLGLAAIMVLVIATFFGTMLEARVQNQVIAEVESQGATVLQRITQTIRNADNITSPAIGASASSLTLDMVPIGIDPTVFNLASGVIRITEGAGSAVALTNSRVTVSALTFRNLSRISTPGTIRIQFTLTYVNPSNRQEYNYARTFYGSASLR